MASSMENTRKELAGEYERVQKKAFTNWINSHLIKVGQKVNDLYEDLRDGSRLLMLIEIFTGEKLRREKGKMRVHKLQNIQNVLDYLTTKKKIKLVNIHSESLVEGKPTTTLGLVWSLILHFQISGSMQPTSDTGSRPMSPVQVSAAELKKKLLRWAQAATEGYEEVEVRNFTTSWKDGLAFCAIIDRHLPDLLNYDECDPDTPLSNLELAMNVAEKELGIVRIIDPEDIHVEKPDDKAVMTYVSFLHNAFPDMPPSRRKRGSEVSVEEYGELFTATRKWVESKRKEVGKRNFPNSVAEMKARAEGFQAYKSKELPPRQRDVAMLRDMFTKLMEQAAKKKRGAPVPVEMTFEPLEAEWVELQRENEECENAIKTHLDKLQKLENLAQSILASCATTSVSLETLEQEVEEFETSCTSLPPQMVQENAATIRDKLQKLEKPLGEMASGVEELEEGNYHNLDTVKNSVNRVKSKHGSLFSRLEGASSVATEAQEVVKVEDSIQELEVWLVSCGKFAANQNILGQIEEHREFEREQLTVARGRVTRITASPPPPGLEGRVSQMTSRWQQILRQTDERLSGLEPLEDIAREFDGVKNPLEDWLLTQTETFDALPLVEVAVEVLEREGREMCELGREVEERRREVERLEELATKFEMETEPVQSLADRYARRLKKQGSIPDNIDTERERRDPSAEPEASFIMQADALQSQWVSLQAKVDTRSKLVENLLIKLNEFNSCYEKLREFVEEGNRLLGNERPVGESAARLQEQVETCQDFRSQLTAKQPEVDYLLTLGREIVAEPQTSAANDDLETRLTCFIQDWSDLQLAWQNWYDELHARRERAGKMGEEVGRVREGARGVRGAMKSLFPARVEVETLQQDLQHLQERFTVEVYQPYESLVATCDDVRGSAAMLTDQSAAQEAFQTFDSVSCEITSCKQELDQVVEEVKKWWGGWDTETKWLEGAESKMADLRPLVGSVTLIKTQKEENETLHEEVKKEHGEEMEGVLTSLTDLASHDKLVEATPINDYGTRLRSQWEAVLEDSEKRVELSTSGHTHLCCYADQSTTFDEWLSSTEQKLASSSAIPGSREGLVECCAHLHQLVEEIEARGPQLDTVETTGASFMASAKPYQVRLQQFRSKVGTDESSTITHGYFVDPDADVTTTTAPEFESTEYENGITTVKGYSVLLRRRYDSLATGSSQLRRRAEEARKQRAEFDGVMESLLPRLQELEDRAGEVGESRDKISDRLETLRVIEVDAVAMEMQLQALQSACELLDELCNEGAGEGGGGESESVREKGEAEGRHRHLMTELARMKEHLNAELSDAQAFQDIFSDFDSWLRETERKIQRDDPLKLEMKELKKGLAYLQSISGDIAVHEAAFEKVRAECCDLIGRGAGDPEELQRNLDTLQQRWNAVQIVNDDIEAIESTIPRLETFNSSYSVIYSAVCTCGQRLGEFSTSATTTGGVVAKRTALKAVHGEVEEERSKFDDLLQSCDLYDTPFDHTHFEGDVTSLRERLASCDKTEAEKQASLTVLEKKLVPMEDQFSAFSQWLAGSETALSSLSPPAEEDSQQTEQLTTAKEIVDDVMDHEAALSLLETAVNDVITLVDESDQSELGARLQTLSLGYHCHGFCCHSYPVQRWLDDRSVQLCCMCPCAVQVTDLQNELQEVQDFKHTVSSYQPQLLSLDAASAKCCTPPPTPERRPKPTKHDQTGSEVSKELQAVWERYNSLEAAATEREAVLTEFLPSVQQHESSQGAWLKILENWEETVANMSPPATTPSLIEQQIQDIKDLLQSVSDHEPEFTSLKKEAHTLCQGAPSEHQLLTTHSQLRDSSAAFVGKKLDDVAVETPKDIDSKTTHGVAMETPKGRGSSPGKPPGWTSPRPGQGELEKKLSEYERRLEELKEKLGRCLGEREKQLGRARECNGLLEGVGLWLKKGVADLEGLKVKDPRCSVIEEQQSRCQAMMEEMSSRSEDRNKLHPLVQELTSDLSADNEERVSLLQQLNDLNREWEELQQQLSGCRDKLDSAHSHAAPYEEALQRLFPWIPDTLSVLEGLGACPTEPEAVEERKNKIEAMKGEYNTLAPVCAGCLENARSLSSLTDPGDPKTTLDNQTSHLHDDWEKLGALFGDILAKLTEALVQTQEFKSIADGLEQWMTGMGQTLNQQELIAARVKLVEGQIEGFKPIQTDVAAYGETVEKTRALGDSLKEESEEEEREKIDRRLEALTSQFAELQEAAGERMRELEDALKKAGEYEGRCDEFDQWLGEAETRLRSRDPLSIASQPLSRQEEEIREFQQEVESYRPAVEEVTHCEETLLSVDRASLLACESGVLRQVTAHRRSSTPRSFASPVPPPSLGEGGGEQSSSDHPEWLERPGASEAVVVGADIRTRYSALQIEAGTKVDEATQLLQTVLGYEADCGRLKEWLGGQSSTVAGFAPPGITVETIRAQLAEVEDLERGFTNTQESLESVNARGTTLVDGCHDELSRESGRSSLAGLNEAWGECLEALSAREEMLKRALELAEKYQDGYGEFDGWLSGCVEKAAEALKVDGDPSEITRQLQEQQTLLEEVKGRKPALMALVSCGRSLEDYVCDNGGGRDADIGYTKMEQRYNTLQASLDGRISKLEQTLDRVGSTRERLRELLAQEEEWRERLEHHPSPRALPVDIERQLAEFSVTEQQYIDLQPAVSEALRQANMFATTDNQPTPPPPPPSTETDEDDLAQLHSSLSSANEEVGQLMREMSERLRSRQSSANKFDQDYNGLMSWVKAKDEELLRAEAVAGTPERVSAQISEVDELQSEVGCRRGDLTAVATLSDSLCQGAVHEDTLALGEKTAGLKAAYEALERDMAARRRALEDGLKQARGFVEEWEAAMGAVEAKSQELEGMSVVGADIESVKNQLEEHKEFTESVSELKPQMTEVQAAGKRLKEASSTKDGPAITQQLDMLSAAWAKLNTDTLNRKHQLEDALLQLGQFHDALAQLLSWIADSTGKLAEAPPPGVKSEAVEMQLNELKSLDSAIASHEATVASLNEAARKLMVSNSAENTAETEQDIASLNEKWERLKYLSAERRSSLDTALERARRFHDNWKRESDWLTEAERRAYADWMPRGLPETCDEEIREHEVFTGEVQSHEEALEVLRGEGEELKSQGGPDDQKRVGHWVEDLAQRLDELGGAVDDRQVQLQQAREKAGEFDGSYRSLAGRLKEKEASLSAQEPIHSEVEVVKRQLEENKEFLKGVAELEGQLDTLEGLGMLLAGGCIAEDKEVILQRASELRAMWDTLNSAAMERQAILEESLLSLGEFEDAYSELWAWLTDALRQLGEAEPITGDPDMVAAQLARHKALQKQLGARMSSRNAVTKAAKALMKQKTGEDRAVLKKKLQDLEREWEKVCQMSVDRQSKLEEAYRDIGQFRAHLGPLRTWMAKVLPSLDESEPVHGDLETVLHLTNIHKAFQKELGSYQRSADSANSSGEHLVAEVLDDPTVTKQDMSEMNTTWDGVCVKSVRKQERLDKAQEAAQSFEEGLSELLGWMEERREILDSMAPPDEDASVLQEQIEENKVFGGEVTGKQGEYERVRGECQHLLQLAHPQAVAVLGSNLSELERAWLDLRGRIGARSEALASLLLELHGLQDMLGGLWEWVAGAEATMAQTEASSVGNDMETVETQLAQHEAFQEEMATHQPNMDALNKIAKKRKAETPTTNPEMTKRITNLYKRWQRLWLRSSERHRQLLEARTRLNDIALARSFNFDAWRKRFNGWVDQQKLRVNDLFRRFDSNHDGMLTREEFMKGLKASGLAMNQIELEKIADHFDRDRDGYIDLSEISSILRGLRRARSLAKKQPISDSEKIDYEIQHQVSRCSCSKKFKVVRVAEGQYRFGDFQKLRLVRILRSTVMVRVGGGWEPLEEFLRKHDPCRATGRTNASLRGMDVGLTTASFATKTQTTISHKHSELYGGGEGEVLTEVSPASGSRKTATLPTKRSTTTLVRPAAAGSTATWSGRGSRETTPTRSPGLVGSGAARAEPLRHTLVRQGSPKTKAGGHHVRSKTPNRGLSPPTEGGKSPRAPTSAPSTPSHIPKPAGRRPISPSPSSATTTTPGGGARPSGIPTPSSSSSRAKLTKTSPRLK